MQQLLSFHKVQIRIHVSCGVGADRC